MADYADILINALKKNDVIRKTDLSTGDEAIFQNGYPLFSTRDSFSEDLIETIKPEPELVLFGAGHVGKAVYDLARMLGFSVTVLDEREELANAERFPDAEIIVKPYSELLADEHSFFRPYYLIFTHGHKYDKDCLRYALCHDASYIGMIGSKGKVKATMESLKSEGFSESSLNSVHSPIGLEIGAVTPEEIAVSIIAEVISVYRSDKNMITLSPQYLKSIRGKKGVAARIVEKRGSAPRAIGSEIMVTEDGAVYGTIGGGAIEKEAIENAKRILKKEESPSVRHYALNPSGDLGMICGGDVTLLFSYR